MHDERQKEGRIEKMDCLTFFLFATIPKFFISSLIACNQNVAKMGTEIMVNIYRKRQQQNKQT
jgi:hypothetical protein